MAETTSVVPKKTLGLTGLTSNAMALIAPGAFLWLTFAEQTQTGGPGAGMSMMWGIGAALLLCLATAVAYAELSKLYPGAGSSYFFAEQAFLSKKMAFRWARIMKFLVGWASHLYYWVYPGVMVGVTALLIGYLGGQVFPKTFSTAIPSPLLMFLFALIFSFGVAYIAFRGVGGTTGVNAVINVIQIVALLIFSVMAIIHRAKHPEGSAAWTMDNNGNPINFVQDAPPKMVDDPNNPGKKMADPTGATDPRNDTAGNAIPVFEVVDKAGNPVNGTDGKLLTVPSDKEGKPDALPAAAAALGGVKVIPQPFTLSYVGGITSAPNSDGKIVQTYQYHPTAKSVIAPHGFSYIIIQACVAILILVGFESVTAMGEEARNAKRDIPKAVILSLVIQGGFCYMLEYFAANYFMHSGYQATANAAGSSAPIGDMMQLVGAWALGSANAGWWFMIVMAFTVFLALIGTTLSCLSTGARVTYAMGRDEEVPTHFGMLHGKHASPHRAVWALAIISFVLGCATVATYYCGPAINGNPQATYDSAVAALPDNIWYKYGTHRLSYERACKIPQSLLTVTLISNFGTFVLYMLSCLVAIVAFHEHKMHNLIKHKLIPAFGLLANLLCMAFYLVGPFFVAGMSKTEPYIALGVAAVWGIYGLVYFMMRSRKIGRPVLITAPPAQA